MRHIEQRPPTANARLSRSLYDYVWDPGTARVLSTTVLFGLALLFLYAARETLTLFLFAILFAYFLAPMVSWLQHPLHGRGKAILVVYLGLSLAIAGLSFLFGPHIATDARSLLQSLPELVNRFASGQIIHQFGEHHHWTAERDQQLQNFIVAHRPQIVAYVTGAVADAASPLKHIWWIFLIPILAVFFLLHGDQMAASTASFWNIRRRRKLAASFLDDVNAMLGKYVRAEMILASMTMVAYITGLSLLRAPYAFVLGPASGLLEFIPVVGPAVGAASVVIIALLAGYNHILWLIFFLGCWRLQQDYFSAPRIMGGSLKINPLLQIFAVLVGGEVAGVVGALVSVPVVAILRILWRLLDEDSAKMVEQQAQQQQQLREPALTAPSP